MLFVDRDDQDVVLFPRLLALADHLAYRLALDHDLLAKGIDLQTSWDLFDLGSQPDADELGSEGRRTTSTQSVAVLIEARQSGE